MCFLRAIHGDGICTRSPTLVKVAVKVGNLWEACVVPRTHESSSQLRA